MSNYYRIKQFSELTMIPIRTLHYYDDIGLLKPTQKTINNYRLYSDNDRLRLQQITILKFLGYSLDRIKMITSHEKFDIKSSLKTQAQLLAKKSTVAKDAKWLIEQIILQIDQSNTVNWQMVNKIMTLLQLDENDSANWQKHYYTENEYNELAQATLRYSSDWWENYYARWRTLFKEVESQLHTDPEGEIGVKLAEKWLNLKDEVALSPEVQRKGWEAMQKGIMPQEAFAYNPKVIEYITKAIKKYRELQQIAESNLV
jgi:DNA-binding transcriptional MerR regulator